MTRLDQKLDLPPAVCDASAPPHATASRGPMVAWATNIVLALLAIWPAMALIRAVASPEFVPTLANVIAGFTALVLVALGIIAFQPRERKRDLTLAAVACFGAFLLGDLLLGWKQMSVRAVAETFLVRPSAQRQTTASLLSPSARDRLPPVDRRSPEDLRKVLANYAKHPVRMANISLLLPAIEAGELPPFLPLSWPADAVLPGCNEGDQRQHPIFRTDRFGFNNEDWVYLWDREKVMLVGDSFAVGECVHPEQTVQGVMRRSGLATTRRASAATARCWRSRPSASMDLHSSRDRSSGSISTATTSSICATASWRALSSFNTSTIGSASASSSANRKSIASGLPSPSKGGRGSPRLRSGRALALRRRRTGTAISRPCGVSSISPISPP
jgi:hypothetical protein